MSFGHRLVVVILVCLISAPAFGQPRPTRNDPTQGGPTVPGRPTRPGTPTEVGRPTPGITRAFPLLPRIKIQTQTRRGRAKFGGGKLHLTSEEKASQVVLTSPHAPEYDLTVSGVRNSGDGNMVVGFVKDGVACHFVVNQEKDGGYISGLRTLQNKNVVFPNAYEGSLITVGKPFELVLHVRKAEVGVEFDGKKIFYWQGSGKDPYPEGSGYYKIKEDPSFSIGSWNSTYTFDAIDITLMHNAEELAWKLDSDPSATPAPATPDPATTAGTTDSPSTDPMPTEPMPTEPMPTEPMPVDSAPKVDEGVPPRREFIVESKTLHGVSIGPNSRYVAVGVQPNSIAVFDAVNDKQVRLLDTGDAIRDVAFGKAKSKTAPAPLYAASGKHIQEWDLVAGEKIISESMNLVAGEIAYDPKYDLLYASMPSFQTLYALRVEKPLRQLGSTGTTGEFAFSPNSGSAVVIFGLGELWVLDVWDERNNRINFHSYIRMEKHPTNVSALAFSKNSKHLAVGFKTGEIRIYDLSTKGEQANQDTVATFQVGQQISDAVFSSDGKQLALSNEGIAVYDAATGDVMKEILPKTFQVSKMTVSRDRKVIGAIVQTPPGESKVKLWSADQFFEGESSGAGNAASPPAETFRTWRTADGKYEIEAALVRADAATVYLKRKETGATIPVKRSVLSAADQSYLRIKTRE